MLILIVTLVSILAAVIFALLLGKRISINLRNPWIMTGSVFVFICGIVLLWFVNKEVDYYQSLKRWIEVEGIVTAGEIAGSRAIRPQVFYQYTVGDSTYTGQSNLGTPGFGGRNSRKQTSRNILKEYPVGTQINVFVNPQRPDQSLLRIATPWNVYMKLVLAAILIMIGTTLHSLMWFRNTALKQ